MNEEKLFLKGINEFNKKNYYYAHEYWEEIWNEIKIPDDKFLQGLIQLAVAYFHISNNNLIGAKSLFNKCINKLVDYRPQHRGLNIESIISHANNSLDTLIENSSTINFNWELAPILTIKKSD